MLTYLIMTGCHPVFSLLSVSISPTSIKKLLIARSINGYRSEYYFSSPISIVSYKLLLLAVNMFIFFGKTNIHSSFQTNSKLNSC